MKYTYAYKTSDGVRHEDSMNAASREEVFAELRKRGIKAMVEGLKNEARSYIAAGGTIVEYGKRLTERQDAEIAVYNRVKADLEKARSSMFDDAFMSYWKSATTNCNSPWRKHYRRKWELWYNSRRLVGM